MKTAAQRPYFYFFKNLQASLHFLRNKKTGFAGFHWVAEKGGFEPPVPVAQYDSLANCWFKPLTHLSVNIKLIWECKYRKS
jgi:hypothetical protein